MLSPWHCDKPRLDAKREYLRAGRVSAPDGSPALEAAGKSPSSSLRFFLRKRAMIEWSGFLFAATTRKATSVSQARSISRLDRSPTQ